MCGIVGVISHRGHTLRPAVDALKRLEYRGYDSFGVATLQADHIVVKKDVGSVIENDARGFFADVPDSTSTIAHTRWATHGKVTQTNAHPHISADGSFILVHNGVIENHRQLRDEVVKAGVECVSETDTEVVAQLLAIEYQRTGDLTEAVRRTLVKLDGEYAFAFFSTHDPGHIYGARHKSPLGYAVAGGTGMIASDQRAIAPTSQSMRFLEDGDFVRVSPDGATCYALRNGSFEPVEREVTHIRWTGDDEDRHGYPHYMIKEIYETPLAVENALKIRDHELDEAVAAIPGRDLNLTGAGSAFYVSQISQYYFAAIARRYARVHPSDEFLSLIRFTPDSHLIAVSQSGETFDTLEVLRAAKGAGARVTSINNVFGSSCQRLADFPIFQGAGSEICVLSTKSIVSQAIVLFRLAVKLAVLEGAIDQSEADALMADAARLPAVIHQLLDTVQDKIRATGIANSSIDNWFFIGRGIYYPVAMEGALKFKEVSYLHAEGMSAGFFKHGTISLIDENFYTIAFLPSKTLDADTFRFTMSNISEIQARSGRVIAFGHEPPDHEDVAHLYDYIQLPSLNLHLDPILHLIAGQLLAYHCAVSLGRNIDKPRSLAKSVTVR